MNINLVKLAGIERELRRLNANIELLLLHAFDVRTDVPRPRAARAGKMEVSYTDETEDALREQIEDRDKASKYAAYLERDISHDE